MCNRSEMLADVQQPILVMAIAMQYLLWQSRCQELKHELISRADKWYTFDRIKSLQELTFNTASRHLYIVYNSYNNSVNQSCIG